MSMKNKQESRRTRFQTVVNQRADEQKSKSGKLTSKLAGRRLGELSLPGSSHRGPWYGGGQ